MSNPVQIPITAVRDEQVPAVEADQVSSVPSVTLYIRHVELSTGSGVYYESDGLKVKLNVIIERLFLFVTIGDDREKYSRLSPLATNGKIYPICLSKQSTVSLSPKIYLSTTTFVFIFV